MEYAMQFHIRNGLSVSEVLKCDLLNASIKVLRVTSILLMATSMLVRDVGDGFSWRQLGDLDDGFKMLVADYFFTNIIKLSPSRSHEHEVVTNMAVALLRVENICLN